MSTSSTVDDNDDGGDTSIVATDTSPTTTSKLNNDDTTENDNTLPFANSDIPEPTAPSPAPVKRGRGRPRKVPRTDNNDVNGNAVARAATTAPAVVVKKSITRSSTTTTTPQQESPQLGPLGKSMCPLCRMVVDKDKFEEHYNQELKRMETADASSQLNDTPLASSIDSSTTTTTRRTRRTSTINALIKSQLQMSGDASSYDNIQQSLGNIRAKRDKRSGSQQHQAAVRHDSIHSFVHNNNNQSTSDDDDDDNHKDSQSGNSQRCFVCSTVVQGDLTTFNLHLDKCLESPQASSTSLATATPPKRGRGRPRKNDPLSQSINNNTNNINNTSNSNNTNKRKIDELEDEDDFSDLPPGTEVYEFAGQTRIRTCTLLENGYEGIYTPPRVSQQDEDGDLDIEEDDTVHYGNVQYTEDDLPRNKQASSTSTTIMTDQSQPQPQPSATNPTSTSTSSTSTTTSTSTTNNNVNSNSIVIDALKERIREQEKMLRDTPCCLVCMGVYQTPLVSVKCWHVHCEQCWLSALQAKKWCPQCNIITTPSDLRKIYL
ncbi:hypothetical protein SAMD00019534_015820 [Acytostelium subglobosum LB1]|uniref:hypothetical protein n=1 Tax=Acytostelium subglobosum LB1 TaxID=1410327 RepID=UPI000644887D|nr:hypothetical protein SAMD00019534_015820 [Acytostelium subglobosum LB1]GAM18407.1 hypothetical protein SAMD00019534_015820 [Acytostelium subglobosum LB1]|eukprot:XP_012757627.1 hypothetical protein SAMD00019534_015820 [Acytostelium subglobosum LB1]